jgi:hypothetical protein
MIPHSITHKQLDPTGTHCPWVKASIPPQNTDMYLRHKVQNIYWTGLLLSDFSDNCNVSANCSKTPKMKYHEIP